MLYMRTIPGKMCMGKFYITASESITFGNIGGNASKRGTGSCDAVSWTWRVSRCSPFPTRARRCANSVLRRSDRLTGTRPWPGVAGHWPPCAYAREHEREERQSSSTSRRQYSTRPLSSSDRYNTWRHNLLSPLGPVDCGARPMAGARRPWAALRGCPGSTNAKNGSRAARHVGSVLPRPRQPVRVARHYLSRRLGRSIARHAPWPGPAGPRLPCADAREHEREERQSSSTSRRQHSVALSLE